MRTIKVTGRGRLKLRPDMTRITLSLEGGSEDYADTLRCSSKDTETLREVLAELGFDRGELKTLSFHVDTEFESYEERGVYKRRFLGYKFYHTLKLEFSSDNELLGRVLAALAACPVRAELQLGYAVRDREAAKNALLASAVSDARTKAEALTQAAGLRLKQLQSIDYSWGELNLEVRPMNRGLMMAKADGAAAESYSLDIEPDDVEVADNVTLIWEID